MEISGSNEQRIIPEVIVMQVFRWVLAPLQEKPLYLGIMKAKISKKGTAFLKSTQASNALIEAIVNNFKQLSNGTAIPFHVLINDGRSQRDLEVKVRKVTSM